MVCGRTGAGRARLRTGPKPLTKGGAERVVERQAEREASPGKERDNNVGIQAAREWH
jgi:hypothetical protein